MHLRLASCTALLLVLVLVLPASANVSSKLYIVYMGEKKHDDPSVVTASHHGVLASILGSKNEAVKSIVYSYRHGFSGFAAMLTDSQAETIMSLPDVVSVDPNTHYQIGTTRSWDFLGLDHYQSSPSRLLKKANYGEDIIVGVVDTGIWPESRSFDDSGYGPVPARWKGACQTGVEFNATGCNRKIIGARWYTGGLDGKDLGGEYKSPRDTTAHGTHVASTIAGVEVRNVSFAGLAAGVARGGAPRARLAVYKACWRTPSADVCDGAALLAAVDDATNDGVDVLSLSLSGTGEFYGTLHAVARGIPVVFIAGNNGPAVETVRNAVPWVLTVAASTIDRSFPTMVLLGNNEKLVGQSRYIVNSTVNNSDFYTLVYAGSCDAPSLKSINVTSNTVLCSAPWEASPTPPPQGFQGAFGRITKAGAKGLIFAQDNSNSLVVLNVRRGVMPCVLVDFEMAHRIQNYITSTRKPLVRIFPTVSVTGNGVLSPRVAAFSSRGPSASFPSVIKPDVAAPGVGILAAVGDSYKFMSGTSMACPHISAIVALLKSFHPDWSPAMIKSAIVTTASVTDRFGMPIQAEGVPRKLADPFDFGGGHIDPERAADPGLVYDVDVNEYTKFFNCTLGPKDDCTTYMGQLYKLNLPSIAIPDLKGTVTVSRIVTNVGLAEATYKATIEAPAGVDVSVEPSLIRFSKGDTKKATFKVTFAARQRVQGGYTFGSLTWLDGNTHSVRIPIVVRTVIQEFIADTS